MQDSIAIPEENVYWPFDPPTEQPPEDEPEIHLGHLANFTDQYIEPHKRAITLILHEIASSFPGSGSLWGTSVLEIATDYGWCPSDVLPAARVMASIGLIRLETDTTSTKCGCDACVAKASWITLPVDFGPAERALRAQYRGEADAAKDEAGRIVRQSRSHGFVYLVKCGPRHKIGVTSDMNRRMDQLRGQSPYPLEIVHYAQGHNNSAMESRLHQEYAEHRVHGEWFEFGPDQIAAVIEAMNDWQKEAR